jgi:hypothetical protein
LYLQDYSEHFSHHEYSSPESAHDFTAFSLLNGRLKSGRIDPEAMVETMVIA